MACPLLLGHRGSRAPKLAPENTFAAFDLALEHGCDGFEFDVRLTGCRRALVCHGPRIGGVTVSRAGCHQLRDVPQLEEVLAGYGQRVFLDIELKVRGLEPKLLAALRQDPPAKDYVVSSFLPDVVLEIVARGATPVGIICEKPQQLARWPKLPVQYVIAHHSLVKRRLVEEIHDVGRKIVVWTVNDARSMRRLAEWGVDAIISDNTGLLVKTLKA
jgi:glycerophosphoryl diester phosphodiesterase